MNNFKYSDEIRNRLLQWKHRQENILNLTFDLEPRTKKDKVSGKKFVDLLINEISKKKINCREDEIVINIRFQVNSKNPPQINTLLKNYLDLLHKRERIDSSNLLFKDDKQIAVLFSELSLYENSNPSPKIELQIYDFVDFIEDIKLVFDIYSEYSIHELIKERDSNFEKYYNSLHHYQNTQKYDKSHTLFLKRELQRHFFSIFNLNLFDLSILLSNKFNYKQRKIINRLKDLFILNILEKHDAKINFNLSDNIENIKTKTCNFKNSQSQYFPLLYPLNLILFFDSKKSTNSLSKDLDNLSSKFSSTINDMLKPPIIPIFENEISKYYNPVTNKSIDSIKPLYSSLEIYKIDNNSIKISGYKKFDSDIIIFFSSGFPSGNNLQNQINNLLFNFYTDILSSNKKN